jgi:hypothetical protein
MVGGIDHPDIGSTRDDRDGPDGQLVDLADLVAVGRVSAIDPREGF